MMLHKLSISLLFFTLFLLFSSASFAQVLPEAEGNITIQGDSLVVGPNGAISGFGSISDSALKHWNGLIPELPHSSKHYFLKDDKRYYIDNVPPAIKGKEIDHSGVWLLGGK